MLEVRSVAMPSSLDWTLHGLLVRDDGQEDLTFALWYPSEGLSRTTALLVRHIEAEPGDREIHGNVSFNPGYLQRALEEALRHRAGLAFLHSHPFPGWQHMSEDDGCGRKPNRPRRVRSDRHAVDWDDHRERRYVERQDLGGRDRPTGTANVVAAGGSSRRRGAPRVAHAPHCTPRAEGRNADSNCGRPGATMRR